jgi:predicted DNA-binding ribbon-helix-helix protein
MRKRSVALRGHSTSISLEDEFWAELKRIAAERAVPLSTLVAEVDGLRSKGNLSSALRLTVLQDLQARLAAASRKAGD